MGRLDYDAEGVMLLTNDGEFCDKLIHPKYHVPKKYLVKVRNIPDEATLQKLRDGVYLDDGRTRPATVKFVRKTEGNAWIEIIVTEGKNRLIKRMCQRVGHPVNKLKRIEFAGIGLGKLALGEWRFLTAKEVEGLISMPMPSALPRTRPRPDAQTKPARSARPERSGKHGRFARPERSGKPEERSGKPARFARPERWERSGKPARFAKPERSARPERFARPERSGRPRSVRGSLAFCRPDVQGGRNVLQGRSVQGSRCDVKRRSRGYNRYSNMPFSNMFRFIK